MTILQSAQQQVFDFFPALPIVVEASQSQLSSDGGLLPIRQFDEQIGLTQAFADALDDNRSPALIDHTVPEMVRSRVYGILADYIDQNDHDHLRTDPVFKLIAGRSPADGSLASQPTLSRFENQVTIAELKRLRDVLIDQFVASFAQPPRHLTFDLDAVDDPAHGAQQLVMFHGFYEQYQYLPLAITNAETDQVVMISLRPGNVHAALGADDDLTYLVTRLRQVWPDVVIHARGDAACGVPWMLDASERLGIDYSYGLASNAVLQRYSEPLLAEAVATYEQDCQTARAAAEPSGRPPATRQLFDGFWYQAGTWPHERWVVVKAEANAQGSNRRFVLTNRPGALVFPRLAYEDYAGRGEGENRNKELKCGLSMDRLSDHRFVANYFRLYLHVAALNLLVRVRRAIADPPAPGAAVTDALAAAAVPDPAGTLAAVPGATVPEVGTTAPSATASEPTPLGLLRAAERAAETTGPDGEPLPADALPGAARRRYFRRRRRQDPLGEGQPSTWRTLFIKVAAEVIVSSRRILVRLSGSWPYLHFFQRMCQRLCPQPPD